MGFVADINASSVRMNHFQTEVFALDLPQHLPSLLAVHLVPMVLRWMIGCSFVFLLWFGFHANLPMSNSTWPGPVGENYSNSPAGSGRSPFQDNACHHLYNRQHRSHAPTRAATLQSKSGLSCRARLCLGFYLGHTITGELSKGVSGSYNHRKAVACAPMKISLKQSGRVALTSLCGPDVPAA